MNLLERTRRLLQGLTPPSPPKVQHYSVACPEGHRLRGERTEGYQALRCPTCGEGIFVLPRSPLPEVAAPEGRRPSPRSVPDDLSRMEDDLIELSDPVSAAPDAEPEVDGEIEWVDPLDAREAEAVAPDAPVVPEGARARQVDFPGDLSFLEDEPPRPRPATPTAREESPTPRPRPRPRAPKGRAVKPAPPEPPTRAEPASARLRRWAGRHRNPLIFAGVGLIVVSTIGIRVWRSRFEDLPRIAERGRVQGLAALEEGNFDTANHLLSEAKRAVIALGDAVEGAADIRQGADEAAIYTSLVPEPLETILAKASSDPKEWASRFSTDYQGRAIIVDAHVDKVLGVGDSRRYQLDYVILPSGREDPKPGRIGRVDLSGFRLFDSSRPKVGDRVCFGARLVSFELDVDREVWVVGLEPDSGVWMTHRGALEAAHWPAADEAATEAAP